jgi:hypothetical protein
MYKVARVQYKRAKQKRQEYKAFYLLTTKEPKKS